jgi:hypothetical protein
MAERHGSFMVVGNVLGLKIPRGERIGIEAGPPIEKAPPVSSA